MQAAQAAVEGGDVAAVEPALVAEDEAEDTVVAARDHREHRRRRLATDRGLAETDRGLPFVHLHELQILQALVGHPALLQVAAQIAAHARAPCRTA